MQQGSTKDGYIPAVVFLEHFVFSQPDWYVEPDQNCTLPLGQEWENRKYKLFDW